MSHQHHQLHSCSTQQTNRRLYAKHSHIHSWQVTKVGLTFWTALTCLLFHLSTVHADVRYVYDEAGRLVQVISPTGESARYTYDAAGNLISITRAAVGDLGISEFTPDRGPIGTTVIISGVGFSTTPTSNIVKFNGVTAVVSAATATTITTKVPTGATTGPITVTVGTKVATSAIPFTVTTGPVNGIPTITSFTPTIGAVGTVVAISGTNYDPTPANNFVHFNTTQATVTSSTLTTINTTVPTGATSGPIKVRNAGGTALSTTDFFVVPAGQTAANISVTQRMAVDGPTLAINTGTAGKIAMVLFTGTQGQNLGLGVSPVTVTGGSATLFIKTPSGADLIPQRSFSAAFSLDLPRLTETGSYTMLIVPSTTAAVSATLTLSSDVASDIAADGTAKAFTSTRVGQNARYTFSAATGQNFSLVLSGDTIPGYTYVYVFQPDGNQLTYTYMYVSSGTAPATVLDLKNLPMTGTYTVFISPDLATGSFTTTLWADATATVPTNGTATAVTLPLGRDGRYSFTGTAGQYVGLGISGLTTTPASKYVTITVYKPDGTVLKNCSSLYQNTGGGSCDLLNLPVSGLYTIWVDNGDWVSTFTLILSLDVTGPLTLNGPASVFTTNIIGQNAHYTFTTSVAGQNFSLAITGDTIPGYTYVYVYKPDGSYDLIYPYSTNGVAATGTIDLKNLPIGQYTVFISPQGLATGSINATLWADATATVPTTGVSTAVTLPLGRDGRYSFAGTAGQYIGLGISGLTTTPTGKYVTVTVYKPDGTVLKSCGSFYPSSGGGSCDLLNLPVTGNYAIWVDNGDWTSAFNLLLSTDITGTLTPNAAGLVFTTAIIGQNAHYTFTNSVAGQHYSLAVSDDTIPGYTYVYVYKPDGSYEVVYPYFSSGAAATATIDLKSLPVGTYTVFVSPQNLATGTIKVILWTDATATLPTNGTATALSLPLGRDGRYSFSGTLGQYVGLGMTSLTTIPASKSVTVTVYKPDGTLLKNCNTFYQSTGGTSCDLVNLPVTGTYTIWVNNGDWVSTFNLALSLDVTGTLMLNGPAQSFSSTIVGRNAHYTFTGSAGQNLSLVLSGDTFPGYTYMYVYKPDGSQLTYTYLYYASGAGTTTTLNLNNLPAAGTYTVFISPSDLAIGAINVKLNSQ